MRKFYFSKSKFTSMGGAACALFILSTSCVDSTYDLDTDINMEVNVGGSLTVPIGSTTLLLGDMLDESEITDLYKLTDGSYYFELKDDLTVDIDKIAGEDGLTLSIDTPTEPTTLESSLNTPSFDEGIDFALNSVEIPLQTGLVVVNPSAGVVIGDSYSMPTYIDDLTYGGEAIDLSIPNIPIPAVELPIDETSNRVGFSFGGDIAAPDVVESISSIDLSGSMITISFGVDAIASRFKDDFSMVIPSLSVTLPEGFTVAGSSSNVYVERNIEINDSSFQLELPIDQYTKSLTKDTYGNFEAIAGEILCEVATPVTISGTTSGAEVSGSAISLDFGATITISDMTLVVKQLEIDVEGSELSEAIPIELDSAIESVTSVTLDSANNTIDVAIYPISIPSSINVAGEDIQIVLPYDKFDITTIPGVLTQASPTEDYILTIPLSTIIRGEEFKQSIAINKILLSESKIIEAGVDATTPERHVSFDPQIMMAGTTLYIAMADGSQIVDGKYSISLSDYNAIVKKFDTSSSNDTITADISAEDLKIASAEIYISGYSATIADQEFAVAPSQGETIEIDDQLKEIHRMTFTDRVFVSVDVEADVDLGNNAALELSFDNYTILLPTFLELASDVDYTLYSEVEDGITKSYKAVTLQHLSDGKYVDDSFTYSQSSGAYTYSKSIEITAIDFTEYGDIIAGEEGARYLDLDDKILLRGGIKVGAGTIDSAEIDGSIICSLDYSISDMTISTVTGIIDPEIPLEEQSIDLTDLSEDLEGELSLTLSDPSITITATNELEIPLQITSLVLQPIKEGYTIAPISLTESVTIPAASGDSAAQTTFILRDATYAGSDSSVVLIENLNLLLDNIPDQILISYAAQVDSSVEHTVDLNRDYTFALEYLVNVPIAFDSFSFDYTSRIEDLDADLGDILEYISSLEVELNIENGLPVAISIFEITPLDEDGNVLNLDPLFEGDSLVIAANGTSELELHIADNAAGDLSRLWGLDISLCAEADTTNGAAQLNENQSIVISIAARIRDGINLDLNE